MILCDLTAVFFYDKYIKIVQRDKIGKKMRAGRHQHKNEIPIPLRKDHHMDFREDYVNPCDRYFLN